MAQAASLIPVPTCSCFMIMAEGIWKITKFLFFATGRGGGLQQDGGTECQAVLCGPGEGLQEADEPQDRGLHSGKGQDKFTANNIKINDLCMKLLNTYSQYPVDLLYKIWRSE